MEKKINLVELLKDCPKGMELDCAMFEDVFFDEITNNKIFPICIKRIDGHPVILTKYGGYANCPSSKCVIFPKGKTTWEGFVPPCKFKDGDIIFTHANCLKVGVGNTWISIFKEKRNGGVATYVDYAEDRSDYYSDLDGDKALLCMESDILRQRFATEEEKEKLFQAIKANGYRWNEETKTLEKLIQPNFKVGDEIKYKYPTTDTSTLTIIKVEYDKNRYVVCDKHNNFAFLSFFAQDNFKLIRKTKFDTSTLVPFDSRVLVRDNDYDVWRVAFWGYLREKQDIKYDTTRGVYRQCIPYEGNEHLLGKTDDCEEFYKTWE